MGPSGLTEQERFARNFTSGDGCWLWTGAADRHGYGRFSRKRNGKWSTTDAHRVSYEVHVGPIPAGLRVLHKCDVPACIRPDHLFLGTAADNTADMMAKGRHRFIARGGEACGKSKLTWEQVREIRRRLAAGETGSALAREFGMSGSGISSIKHNEVWRET